VSQIRHRRTRWLDLLFLLGAAVLPVRGRAETRVVGWNNLGMHCMDDDFSVFSILPPFNTLEAQVIRDGALLDDAAGVVVTYRGVADPSGSINTTSDGKSSFWDFAPILFGVTLGTDEGLAGFGMPGAANVPQPMRFDAGRRLWIAEGIPITPRDDAGLPNPYPLMRVEVRPAAGGALLAATDVVLPVSDEMDCRACHASGAPPDARPAAGWVFDPDPLRDHRLNILRLHDERQAGHPGWTTLLETKGYQAAGLYPTAVAGEPILCAACHLSEALPGTGAPGVSPLTRAMHAGHADVDDPTSGLTLDADENRSACYRCHPGSETRCLRGAMGAAVAADGTLAMQCQSCHGSMQTVGADDRVGWLDEPRCQSCHTGTATRNSGQIRYANAFDDTGAWRSAADPTFATNPDVPASGLSLYRFSAGHGGLQCSACHGSTHAELPSSHENDNLQSLALQGHAGALAECGACHDVAPDTVAGGPHGLHPLGAPWVEAHGEAAEGGGLAACRACHGSDDRGTVLSRAQGPRQLQSDDFGTLALWRGFQVSCFACHDGPSSEDPTPNHPAHVSDAVAATDAATPVAIALVATDLDQDALALRIVSQPAAGTVALAGSVATYFPSADAAGSQRFTFAANDGWTDSNLGTVQVQVPAPGASPTALAASVALAALAYGRRGPPLVRPPPAS
jgi:hypothetical protein